MPTDGKEEHTMKIRLDDVMQSFSYPINAVYYYYIPLETVLMFVDGVIYGKAVHGISTEKDVAEHEGDFIKLPHNRTFWGSLNCQIIRVFLINICSSMLKYFGL